MKEKDKEQDSPNSAALKKMQKEGFPEGVKLVAFDGGQFVASGETYEEVVIKLYDARRESGKTVGPNEEAALVYTIDNPRSMPLFNRSPRNRRR